ncbi:hypothetical protein HQ38_04890 [Porphyromonas crevioricanis]|uniref:Uncharacterized protein n=1 Tax=Porphyromonas crevioricanis TaxID=393921 RepID=A0AB34PKK8_9PORP|nr:hypothetical protein HQ38_04890 [Porphyromonas crevioricanis]
MFCVFFDTLFLLGIGLILTVFLPLFFSSWELFFYDTGENEISLLREILLYTERINFFSGEKNDPLRMPMNRVFWKGGFREIGRENMGLDICVLFS